MQHYSPTAKETWTGRKSESKLYLHEKVQCIDLEKPFDLKTNDQVFGLLGYACDEGVRRNQGRIGAVNGPQVIREALGKMPNHLSDTSQLLDCGTIGCPSQNMETAQKDLSEAVTQLLKQNIFPILIGGGHDIAYGHFNGIKNHLTSNKKIGIINFDAHFDLRSNANGSNSGTPFFQIAQESKSKGDKFNYLCIGIRQDANDRTLFETADSFGVSYIENVDFTIEKAKTIVRQLLDFMQQVDHIYLTIDLDGFSSAFAPGVSAASPMGFSPEMALKALEVIIASKKLISLDIAELNPTYDVDNHTSKLAASLIHYCLHKIN